MYRITTKRMASLMLGKWQHVVFWVSIFVMSAMPQIAHQAIVECEGLACKLEDLLEIPVNIFNFLLEGAAIVLLAMIIWAGIRMSMYWFSEQPEQELTAAKVTLTRAIVGFVIVATAILIINILAVTILGLSSSSLLFPILSGLIYFAPN